MVRGLSLFQKNDENLVISGKEILQDRKEEPEMKRKYIFTAVLLAALTAAGFGITVLCGSGGSGSQGKSSGQHPDRG